MDCINKVSIIVRSKNESRWIAACLRAVRNQLFEGSIEIILVDNCSDDLTTQIALEYVDRIINIYDYRPGRAIQQGISSSTGNIIVLLSAHCIPKDRLWLSKLIFPLSDNSVAGVYGRQEPLSFTSPSDKRDLFITFGLDKRIHVKDPFFHNANSAFLRSTLDDFPFNETLSNIEDREWATRVLKAGLVNVYEPTASVYHWHGIHHNGDKERSTSTSLILDSIHCSPSLERNPTNTTLPFIPFLADKNTDYDFFSSLVDMFHCSCRESLANFDKIVFASNSQRAFEIFSSVLPNAEFFRRADNPELSRLLGIHDVISEYLHFVDDPFSKRILYLDLHYIFRTTNEINVALNYDDYNVTLIPYFLDYRRYWSNSEADFVLDNSDFIPSTINQSPLSITCLGLGSIFQPATILSGTLVSAPFQLMLVDSPLATVQVKDANQLNSIKHLIQ